VVAGKQDLLPSYRDQALNSDSGNWSDQGEVGIISIAHFPSGRQSR
jgi:hypothetical protein